MADFDCPLEIIAKPAVVHPNAKTSCRTSPEHVRATAGRAAEPDRSVSTRTFPSPLRKTMALPQSSGLTSFDVLPQKDALICQTGATDNLRTPCTARSDVRITPRIILEMESPSHPFDNDTQGAAMSGEIAPDESIKGGTFETTQLLPVEGIIMRPKPTLPENFNSLSPKSKLKIAKQFLSEFEYKQTPLTQFNTHKLRPLSRIMDTARLIIYAPQSIKCVEAVFLALYLTAGIADCDRVPLGFKTRLNEKVFQHIVLLIRHGNKFGAFGISRHPDLMTKDIAFNSMSEVVRNYMTAYEGAGHVVLKIRVGLQVEHQVDSRNFVCWRHLTLSPATQSWEQCSEALQKHGLKQKRLWDLWLLSGKGGDPKRKTSVQKADLDTKLLRNRVLGGQKLDGDLSSRSISVLNPKPKGDRRLNSSLAATKSFAKVPILSSKTSKVLRQSLRHINPKLLSRKSFIGRNPSSARSIRITKLSSQVVHNLPSRVQKVEVKPVTSRNSQWHC